MTDTEKSACDFTRPATAAEQKSAPKLLNAQYYLTTSNGYAGKKYCIAHGLTYKEAKSLEATLTELAKQHCSGQTNAPVFGIDLRKPEFTKKGPAQSGDFILLPFKKQLNGDVFIETNIAGRVLEVDKDGIPVTVQDRTGTYRPESTYHVFPAFQFDVDGAQKELLARDQQHLQDGYFGYPWGCYEDAKSFAQVLRAFLNPISQAVPSDSFVAELMGCEACI